jgi:hypothetical protein
MIVRLPSRVRDHLMIFLLLTTALGLVSGAAAQDLGTASAKGGVWTVRIAWDAKDSLSTFEYAARNPAALYGMTHRIVIGANAPQSTGHEMLVVDETMFIADATTSPASDIGHVPLGIQIPNAPWSTGVDISGNVYARGNRLANGEYAVLRLGEVMTGITVRAKGAPALRRARLEPFAPVPQSDGDESATNLKLVFPKWATRGETLETLVAGPGFSWDGITPTIIRKQVALACQFGLIAAGNCPRLQQLVTSPRFDQQQVRALLGVRSNDATTHPLVAATLLRMLPYVRFAL